MEIQHLIYFVAVVEEMNFRRAADRLGVTQPTVTKRIAVLEKSLGLDLFIRGKNQILGLTAAGRHYLDDARRLLGDIESATLSARAIAEGKRGLLLLGVCEDAATDRLAKAIAEFRRRLPGVDLRVLELPAARLANGLRGGQIDLSLVVPPVDDRLLTLDPLWCDPWLVVVRHDHELAGKNSVTVADLANVELVLSDPYLAPGAHERIRAAFKSAGIVPQVNVLALRRSTMLFLVAAGTGVTFIPASFSGALVPETVARPFAIESLMVVAAYRAIDPPGMAMQFLRVAMETFMDDIGHPDGQLSGA